MQIHELNTLNRLPNSTDYLAIDTGFDTAKIPANALFADGDTVAQVITEWMNEHPEATTTVEDGSLTYKKLVTGTLGFVTPEMFGAVGDGATDDAQALQDCIDFAFSNKLRVSLPAKTYAVGNPIYLRCGADNSQFGTYLSGSSRGQSVIKALSAMEAVLYFGLNTDSTASAITLEFIHINGDNKANKGIRMSHSTANISISDVKISNCLEYGLYSASDLYLSTFTRVRIDNCVECGISMDQSGINTSCNFISCYVQSSKMAYDVNGIYMNMEDCCADNITDVVLNLPHFSGSIISFGSEANMAKTMFKGGSRTDVAIIGALTWGNFTDNDAVHISATADAKMIFVGGRVLYDWQESARTAPGKMYYTVSTATLRFINVEHAKSTGDNLTNNIYFDNGGWNQMTQHQGTGEYSLPSFFNELLFEITDGTVRIPITIIRQQLVSAYLRFYGGFSTAAGPTNFRLDVKLNAYKLNSFVLSGTDISSTAYVTCYYR